MALAAALRPRGTTGFGQKFAFRLRVPIMVAARVRQADVTVRRMPVPLVTVQLAPVTVWLIGCPTFSIVTVEGAHSKSADATMHHDAMPALAAITTPTLALSRGDVTHWPGSPTPCLSDWHV